MGTPSGKIRYLELDALYARGRLGFLANRATLHLGEISFCLYLCHQSVGRTLLLPWLMSEWNLGFWPAFAIALAGLISRHVSGRRCDG